MTEQSRRLEFGLNDEVPAHAKAAWGARWIYPNDQVWDRQGCFGKGTPDAEKLISWLDGGAIRNAMDASYRLPSRSETRTVILYEDETGIIKGNPRASHGYVYVCGYLRDVNVDGPYEPLEITVRTKDIWRVDIPVELRAQYPAELNVTATSYVIRDKKNSCLYIIQEPTFGFGGKKKTTFTKRMLGKDRPDRKMTDQQINWAMGLLKEKGHEPRIIE